MTEVFDELLVSLQSKTGTLRNGSSRRSRAVMKSSAPLSSASSSSATSPPGSGGPVGGGGPAIRRAGGRQTAGTGLSLSEGEGRPKSDFGVLSTTPNSSTARPGAGGLTVWDRNVSVTDLVHQFLGDASQPPAASTSHVENGWRAGVVKSASQEQVAVSAAHPLSSALSPQLPMRTMKRAKALDPQRLREAERFALEALGASNDDSLALAAHYEDGEDQAAATGDSDAAHAEERRKKDQEWETLMQGLSANASHSRDGLDAIEEVEVGDDAHWPQHPHQRHDHRRHHQVAKVVEEDDDEVKRKTATLEQLLAQLEVNAADDEDRHHRHRHEALSASSSYESIPIPDEEAAPAMVAGNNNHHHHRFGLPASPGGQLRSVSSPALFGPAPTPQHRSVDMRLLNEQLHDGPMLPNDRDAVRLERSAPPGTCARCHQPIPVGAPRLKALDRTYHSGCWVCNQCLRPLNTGAFFMLQGVPHCQYCTHKLTLPACHHCGDTIKDVPVRIGEQKWHRGCLQCMQCKKSLQYETCNDQHGVPLCSACAEPTACFYCAGCGKSIHGEIFVAMNKNWHEGCFACTVCRVPFEHTFYAGPDGRPYCSRHIRPSRSITS